LWQRNGNTVSGSYEKLHIFPSTDSIQGVRLPGWHVEKNTVP